MSEPVCPEQRGMGYAVAPFHLHTEMSWHRGEMKIPSQHQHSETAAQDLPSLIAWQQPTNQMRSHQAQMHATTVELLYKGIAR